MVSQQELCAEGAVAAAGYEEVAVEVVVVVELHDPSLDRDSQLDRRYR